MQNKTKIKRLAINAVLVAVYVALTWLVIPIGGLKITFEHFPVVLCAVLFGPIDAMLVGGVGELINQMMTFGITPTTLLWILPIVVRGLVIGFGTKVMKNELSLTAIVNKKIPTTFMIVCVLSGIIASLLNTLALYVDSRMFGYYSFAMVFGALAVRILLSVLTSVVIGIAVKPIIIALRKSRLL